MTKSQSILGLSADNSDIEDVITKLQEGKDTSIPVTDDASKKRIKRILKKTGATVLDVGYHIGATINRCNEEEKKDSQPNDSESKRTVRSHPVRGHVQPYWHGPKNGPIAADFDNPKPGERYIVMHWIEDYITKPNEKDGLPTVHNVN